jgi:hypothetical protein
MHPVVAHTPPRTGQGPPPTPPVQGGRSELLDDLGSTYDELAEKLPGPLKRSNPFLLGALVLSILAAILVVTNPLGGTYQREVFYPYYYPDDIPTVSNLRYYWDVWDGALIAGGILTVMVLFLVAAFVAFMVIKDPKSPRVRTYLLLGMSIAVAALIAQIAAGLAFDMWAADKDFNDWWMADSYYYGVGGALVVLTMFAIPWRRAKAVPDEIPLPSHDELQPAIPRDQLPGPEGPPQAPPPTTPMTTSISPPHIPPRAPPQTPPGSPP